MKPAHAFPVRVYYEDTDAGGIVYYANYLKFAERARTEALRQAGFDQSALMRDEKIAFAVRHCEIDFLKPARLDDCLTIETRLTDIGRASLTMRQTVIRGGEKLAEITVKLAMVGANMKPARLPEAIKKAMTNLLKH